MVKYNKLYRSPCTAGTKVEILKVVNLRMEEIK